MSVFQFKQFSIQQEYSAAKVGTDGVLLGAWAALRQNTKTVLDIGCGTGLVSLMLAQRFKDIEIQAIEKEDNAAKEAAFNFNQSVWKERLSVINADFLEYSFPQKFDAIVSNPPFFTEQTSAKSKQRNWARQADALPFESLLKKINSILKFNGTLSIIIPFWEEKNFIDLASRNQLFPTQILYIKGNPSAKIKRSLIHFERKPQKTCHKTLIIENRRHDYTDDYILLTKDFYLRM